MRDSEHEGRLAAAANDGRSELPFDQHQRYRIVSDALDLLRETPDPLEVLDVGGGEGIILNFLPEDRVTILDQFDAEGVPGFVKGDATDLPFEDAAFDYVVSVDVYEHIEPGSRTQYLSELRRTARRGVLLAAPFDTEAVREAERLANDFNRAVHLEDNVWLQEHAQNGLPGLDDAHRFFEGHEDSVSVLPNGYVPHWLAMICLTFYAPKLEGEMGGVFDRVTAFYNEFVYESDNAEPSYRHLLVSLKEPADVDLRELVSPSPDPGRALQSSALFGALSAVLPATAELKRLNLRLAREEGALARKEAQVNDLTRRLAERLGAEQRADRLQRAQNDLRQMNADLHKQSADLQRQKGDLQRQKGDLQQQNADLRRQKNDLQRQLDAVQSSRTWRLLSVQRKVRLRLGRLLKSG